jgi:hypothetical protein
VVNAATAKRDKCICNETSLTMKTSRVGGNRGH